MPSIAQMDMTGSREIPVSPTMKKRKREYSNFAGRDDDRDVRHGCAQLSNEGHLYDIGHGNATSPLLHMSQERILLKPRSMKPVRSHDAKRQRISFTSENPFNLLSSHQISHNSIDASYIDDDDLIGSQQHQNYVTTHAKADLSACHICHKRPRLKTDLDSYADCEGCGRRTCFICMRTCRGEIDVDDVNDKEMAWGIEASLMDADGGDDNGNGQEAIFKDLNMQEHRGVVCSWCSKECGPDGHVKCNGCLGLAWGG